MNIKLSSKGNLVITERAGVNVYVNTTGVEDKFEDNSIMVGFPGKDFDRPGEFERDDIFVISLEKRKQSEGKPNLSKINYSEVGVMVVVDEITELTKGDLDLVGEVDVLVLNDKAAENGVVSLIRKVNPFFLVLTGETSINKMEKDLNLKVSETESNYKFDASDFSVEEYSTNLVVLKK